MRQAKRTYSLPADVVQQFDERLPPRERSRFLGKLIQDWLAERDLEELRQRVIEGCREMSSVYKDVDREWNSAAEEVWRERE